MGTPHKARSHNESFTTQPFSPPLPASKRILLACTDRHLVHSLARRLATRGHLVNIVNGPEDGPQRWSPHLYDALVLGRNGDWGKFGGICAEATRADPGLLLVMLTDEPFGSAFGVPDVIITESDERAIAEKLLAVLSSLTTNAA